MPYQLKLEGVPAGYAMQDATGTEGSPVPVVVREFSSSDDGELFVSRLEGLPSALLSKASPQVKPSQIDHLLAIIRPDLSTTLYVNELSLVVKARSARSIKAGEPVSEDDLADIAELTFPGVDISDDAAVVFLFSVNWRKALFFDLAPVAPGGSPRDYNLQQTFGGFFAFLSNLGVFSLDEAAWSTLLTNDWFPFVSLPKALVKTLVGRARGSGVLDILVPEVAAAVRERLPAMLDRWAKRPEYEPHIELLNHAAQRFQLGDPTSAVAIVFPRIEGLLRSIYAGLALVGKPTPKRLAGCLLHTGTADLQPYSWLLPTRFRRYLAEAYFADFQPDQPARLSRHSIGHGVAGAADFNEKHAAIGFLILDQLFYLLGPCGP